MMSSAWVQGVSATFEKTPLVQRPTRGVPLTVHLNIEQRALARRLRARKMSLRDIAKQIGCSSAGIDVMLRGQVREARPIEWIPRRGALCIEEREEILRGLSREDSLSSIARQLGRSTSSVSREVKANGGRDDYRIWPAHQRAQRCAKRPKTKKLSYAPLAKRVTEDLEKLWSPEEIALRLALEFPQEPRMQLSHETILQSQRLYENPRNPHLPRRSQWEKLVPACGRAWQLTPSAEAPAPPANAVFAPPKTSRVASNVAVHVLRDSLIAISPCQRA